MVADFVRWLRSSLLATTAIQNIDSMGKVKKEKKSEDNDDEVKIKKEINSENHEDEEVKIKKKRKSENHEDEVKTKKKRKSENYDDEVKIKKEINSENHVDKIKSEITVENHEEAQNDEGEKEQISYKDKLRFVSVIAQPMASKKLAGRIYRLIRKAAQQKTYLRNGLRDVQSKIKKGETGIVIFAGDVSPIEVMCHLPAVCEEKELPYIYTPSRQDLGSAMGVKRGSLIVLIRENNDYKDLYDKVLEDIKKVPKMF